MIKSLHARQHPFAKQEQQVAFLENGPFGMGRLPRFEEKLETLGFLPLRPINLEILQVNLGYRCNQSCKHCHVDAGPDREEAMSRETIEQCLKVVREARVHSVDITGGAPELHPDFRWLVQQLDVEGVREIIVRNNLTVILSNPRHQDLPEFFTRHKVRLCCSLPFFEPGRTDRQRGEGVFAKSITVLKTLNEQGYGRAGSGLVLDLVYNPSGAFLPAPQSQLEHDFKRHLEKDFGIVFNNLLTITNMPISRFLDFLLESGNYEEYMEKLVNAFNPSTVAGVMCRNTLSVDWQGYLYDCDFNQMLGLKVSTPSSRHITHFDPETLYNRDIVLSQHCYGCTAGSGSGCQGSMV